MGIRKDLPAKIYHYTSLEALCSIVENQEFWLGDSRQMNDYKSSRIIKAFKHPLESR